MTRLGALALLLAPAVAVAGVRPAWGGTVRVALAGEPRETDPALAATAADLFASRALHAPLLELDSSGALRPGLLAEVPVPEAGGRAFRLRLRPGLVTARGAPVRAADVAAGLARLLSRDAPSPHAWIALPILGADALLDGRAGVLAGVVVLSETELLVTLAMPLPDFPWLLATPAAAVRGTGPFAGAAVAGPGAPAALQRNERHHRGRPFADALVLRAADARGAARLLAAGEVDLVVRPDTTGAPLPALVATVAALEPRRLGASAGAVRSALAGLDRAELARRFVHGPAEPLGSLVPAAAAAGAAPASAAPAATAPAARPPARSAALVLLVHGGAPDQRALAERVQVKLFDAGVRAAVEVADPARFAARLRAGDFDVALVPVEVLAPRPALAAAQLAFATRGPAAARRALAELGTLPAAEGVAGSIRLARELDLVPLVVSGARAAAAPRLLGVAPSADGNLDPGDLWLVGGGAP